MDQNREIFNLFEKMCTEIAGPNQKEAFQLVCRTIALEPTFLRTSVQEDETILISNISGLLACKSPDDVRSFTDSLELLSGQLNLQSRKSILLLLYLLANSGRQTTTRRLPTKFSTPLTNNNRDSSDSAVYNQSTSTAVSSELSRQASVAELVKNFSSGKMATDRVDSRKTYARSPVSASCLAIPNAAIPPLFAPTDQMDELVQDVIYAFLGAQGKYLKRDIRGFFLDPVKCKTVSQCDANMLLRLAELGYLHDQIVEFTNIDSGRHPLGLFGQGLVTAIRNEITQYYGMVACLQEQVNRARDEEGNDGGQITLIKIMLWTIEPLNRFQCIYNIANACQDKKGGALASTIFNYLYNGNPKVKAITKELLRAVAVPLVHMLSRWMLDGEIEDPHSEFFIECLSEINSNRLWHDKYRVKESLLPSFISLAMAKRILLIGKSINFLREVCLDKSEIKDRGELELCLTSNSDDLFVTFEDTKLHAQIEKFCSNTSQKVLEIVMVQNNLMNHLHSIRKYLLLGQGDFIGMLMENLQKELDKPAKEIQCYNLSTILDATIRMSNASSDEFLLNHLTVALLNSFDGDSGWDLFTLQYNVDGPLVTMLEPSMSKYKVIFKPLWRIKHIELVLSSKIWKAQICNEKSFRTMSGELNLITKTLNFLTSQMIHFIGQIQYYILFEVIECEWVALCKCIDHAETIDDILQSHQVFLESIKARIFLDENSRPLSSTLETIYTTIMNLDTWQDKFYDACYAELNARLKLEEEIKLSEHLGKFGTNKERQFDRDQDRKVFEHHLKLHQQSLKKIAFSYEQAVRQFLLHLAESNDYNLQLFGIRIDYNEYYKKNDQRLQEPLTFERMRMSSMFQVNKNCPMSPRMNQQTTANPRMSLPGGKF